MVDDPRRLRRLAINDEAVTESLLGVRARPDGACGLTARCEALVRLAALPALDAAMPTWLWTVELALTAGATEDEILDTLIAGAPVVGIARVVAAAPHLALALGYDAGAPPERTTAPRLF